VSIRFVKGSRKRIKAGMAFRVHLSTGDHLLGYVAKDDAFLAEGGDWDCFVVYIFRPGDPDRIYTHDDLLVPPLLVSRQVWTYGLFDVSEPVSITFDRVPDRHCFRSLTGWQIESDLTKTVSDHFTEYCEPCAYSSPCGIHAATTFAGVEGRICETLGLDELTAEASSPQPIASSSALHAPPSPTVDAMAFGI